MRSCRAESSLPQGGVDFLEPAYHLQEFGLLFFRPRADEVVQGITDGVRSAPGCPEASSFAEEHQGSLIERHAPRLGELAEPALEFLVKSPYCELVHVLEPPHKMIHIESFYDSPPGVVNPSTRQCHFSSPTARCNSIQFSAPEAAWTRGVLSKLPLPRLPLAAERDPERQGDQLEVEPERLLLDVEQVVTELLPRDQLGDLCRVISSYTFPLEARIR